MSTLAEVLRRYERAPADDWQCLRFALEAAATAGGADLTPLIPDYVGRMGALRALRATGHSSLIELMDAHATPIAPARARTGDVAYRDQPPIGAMGVVVGGEALFLGPDGFHRMALLDALVWRL